MKNPKIVITDNRRKWYLKALSYPKRHTIPAERKAAYRKAYHQQPST